MVEKLAETEKEALINRVLEKYGRFLRNTIAQLCPRDLGIQIDDIEQEARLRLWRVLLSEREIKDLASYIYRVAATTTIDAVRRVKAKREEQLHTLEEAEEQVLSADADRSPADEVARRQVMKKIGAALASLPDNQRRALGLHLEGMTSQEIADLLEWSEPKARNLIYRGLKQLRELLRAEGIDYQL